MNIAYMSFAMDNTCDASMLAVAQAVAQTDGAKLTAFDANNPQTQFNQLQTVISSGQYNGIITQPIVSTGLTSLVQQAISKEIKVVNQGLAASSTPPGCCLHHRRRLHAARLEPAV